MQSLTKNSTDTGIKTLMSLKFINFLKENKTFTLWCLLGLPQSQASPSPIQVLTVKTVVSLLEKANHPTKVAMKAGFLSKAVEASTARLLYFSPSSLNFVPFLFVLRFYGPVNPVGSCRARSVYITTRLLGRLSPLSG